MSENKKSGFLVWILLLVFVLVGCVGGWVLIGRDSDSASVARSEEYLDGFKKREFVQQLEEFAGNGESGAVEMLRVLEDRGLELEQLADDVVIELRTQAEAGDPESLALIGYSYYVGSEEDGVDYKRAAELFALAAEGGDFEKSEVDVVKTGVGRAKSGVGSGGMFGVVNSIGSGE